MKTLSKYNDFFTNKKLYLECQKFWNDKLSELSQENYEEWVTTKFANGEDFFDGNPIASALYKNINKAVRIIQVASDYSTPMIRIWLEKVDYQSKMIKELVLVVQPYDEAYNTAFNVISFFIYETEDKRINKYIRALNEWQKHAIGIEKSARTIQTIDPSITSYDLNSIIQDIYTDKRQKTNVRQVNKP